MIAGGRSFRKAIDRHGLWAEQRRKRDRAISIAAIRGGTYTGS